MVAARRHSRTPMGLMADEARIMVEAAAGSERHRRAVEVFTGRPWSSMTEGERIKALLYQDQLARAAGAMAGALRSNRDLDLQIALSEQDVSDRERADRFAERIAELEHQNEVLTEANTQLRAALTAAKAAPAMAVHSGEAS